MAARQRVAVFFGGPSVEHDVSVISALQLMAVLDERHVPVPVYLARDGSWWTGDALREVGAYGGTRPLNGTPVQLRLGGHGESPLVEVVESTFKRRDRPLTIDLAICAIHGTGGEDGSLLGALEHAGIAYVGGGVGASAIAMDKAAAKAIFAAAGLAVLSHTVVSRHSFLLDPQDITDAVVASTGLPCYCKPAQLGSSIGVARAATADELREALELALELDSRAIVEPALDDATEINCAVLGRPGGPLRASFCEQPVKSGMPLTFEDKYLQGGKGGKSAGNGAAGKSRQVAARRGDDGDGDGYGDRGAGTAGGKGGGMAAADRLIPAPIAPALTERIQASARAAHEALGFAGVARYDFLIDDAQGSDPRVVLNEANTVPGSFSFYLFEPAGLTFVDLVDELLVIARAEAAVRRATVRTFESSLLSLRGGGG